MVGLSALITALIIVVPLVMGAALSLYKIESFAFGGSPAFSGWANFATVLGDPDLYNAAINGALFAAISVSVQVVFALAVALLLNQRFPGRTMVRAAVVLPMLLPAIVAVTVFRWMTDGSIGILTVLMRGAGLPMIAWGEQPGPAVAQVIFLGFWLWAPFMVVSILAALQNIPASLYEAARVDGAGRVAQFFHITLPQLAEVVSIIVLLRMIWVFNNFDVIWLATRGGPLGATETLPLLSYRKAFLQFDLGGGAAIATLSFVLLLVVVVIAMKILPIDRQGNE
ncbi:MAG: sugar ABC transporter permease [Burkholderiaceae bacterium]